MRKRNIITIAVCGLFLVAAVSAVLLRYERARQLRLKAQSDALLNHVLAEMATLKATDPLFAEMERRDHANNEASNAVVSGKNISWIRANIKDPDEVEKYQEIDPTCTLLAAIRMLRDNTDRKLLHEFILDTPRPFNQSQRELIRTIPQPELATIRGALKRYLPSSEQSSLDDPARLWDILTTRAPELEPQVEAEAARLNKACENWPAAVLRQVIVTSELYLKNRVYTYYNRNHLPLDLQQKLQQREAIEQSLHNRFF